MTIETKIAKNGSLTVKVDFKRAKRNDAERVIRNTSLYGGKVEIIAEPNDPYGVCDIYTGGFDATENCYVFVDGAGNTYHFAYVDDILYDMAHGTLAKRIRKQTSATDVDAEEYAVSTEAQEVAIDAEISAATATNTADEINIDDATYRTILLHAEKISNGQNSFAAVLKNELRNLLNVDASELIEAIKTDSNFLNRVRCYLADFPIIITNDEGTRYHLVKLTDDYCELDIINDEPATEQEKSTIDEPEPPVDDFGAKLAELQAKRDAAQATLLKAQEEHEAAENTLQKFLSDTAGNLATKLQSLELDYSIKLVTGSGYSWTVTDFSDIYVDPFGSGKMFAFTDWRSRRYASYDTPAQVDKVIDMLRAAIERGDKEFKFPTVDELTTTRKAA